MTSNLIESGPSMQNRSTRLTLTEIPDSWAWMRLDLLVRIVPLVLAYGVVYQLDTRRAALGLSAGRLGVQLLFAAVAAPLMFGAAVWVQRWLTRRRGALSVPASGRDAWFQAGFYVVNGPVEEAFFRGLVQGGLGVLLGVPAAFAIATAIYVLYHRLGRWTWSDTFATALVGVPLGLAFWLLPGPPSLVGVSIAHVAATCGFLGPGPYLLKKLNLV
ncbi:MAG: CPBP family intramembrane glutamic endopeptidase [Candidatus Dormibacteraceae bacterium]